jgi:hypothetical protein
MGAVRAARAMVLLLLAPACSFIAVQRPPPRVEPATPVVCSDTYWLPVADVAAVAGLAGLFAWSVEQCKRRGEECDGQAGLLVLEAVPFVVSAVSGATKVSECRRVKAWQRDTPVPPLAGSNGAACVPVFAGEGRCDAGYCVRGRCQAEMPPARLRMVCAESIARWRGERDPARRAELHAALPPQCRPLAR